jgi:histidyl-tRNA synthetase
MAQGALPGFRDFYPAEFAERAHLFAAWRDVARRFAFVEYDGPPLEPLDLFTKKSGAEIAEQLYNFTDKGDRQVALRPEMTPTLARMVAARANALRKPVRWFSIPQLFRYERQQRGRLREHFQLNMDIIGEPDVTADAELLAAAIEIMRTLGLTNEDVVARVSDRRLLNALLLGSGFTEAQFPAAYAALDKLGRDPRPVLEERLAKAGVAAKQIAALFELADTARDESGIKFAALVGRAGAGEEFAVLERYLACLDALGVGSWVRLDLSIVRGLAYYTGIVFELFDAKGELRAICGGGRYDNLLESLGGVDLPALGFGMGDVVLGELLRERKLMPPTAPSLDYWIVYGEEVPVGEAMRIAGHLRRKGYSAEYSLGAQKPARQMKIASTAGAKRAVILAHDDTAASGVMLRDLAAGVEERVQLDSWIKALPEQRTILSGPNG